MTPAEVTNAVKPLIDSFKEEMVKAIEKASGQDWDGLSVIINLGGFMGLLISIWLLSRQTKANQESVDEARNLRLLELIPIVVLETYVATDYHATAALNAMKIPAQKMRYRNIGRGTAFHVNVATPMSSDAELVWDTGQYLPANEDVTVSVTWKVTAKPETSLVLMEQVFEEVKKYSPTLKIPLRITYKDAVGVTYETAMTVAFTKGGIPGVHYHDTLRDNRSIFATKAEGPVK